MYKNDGLKITTFENKPFADFLIENYPNGKPKTWITMTDGLEMACDKNGWGMVICATTHIGKREKVTDSGSIFTITEF